MRAIIKREKNYQQKYVCLDKCWRTISNFEGTLVKLQIQFLNCILAEYVSPLTSRRHHKQFDTLTNWDGCYLNIFFYKNTNFVPRCNIGPTMGNRTGKMSHCDKKPKNSQGVRSGDGTQAQYHGDLPQPNNIADENIYVTERSENSTTASRQDYASSVSVTTGSISDLSVHGTQHIIRETANTIHAQHFNNPHIGDNINCYGPVSFVSSSQSNVQVINQQCAPIVHDFGMLPFPLL